MNLQNKYFRGEFLDFIQSFIPNFQKDIRKVGTSGLKATSEVYYLGESPDLDLAIFELTHTSSSDARVTLATEGFRIMKDSANYRALIAYIPEKSDEWRFSLMTATPDITEKGKVILKLSNPKRYSYFLGPEAKINTPYSYLIKKGRVADFDELKRRFSLEVVNKEFYLEIAELYTKLVGGVRGEGKKKREYKGLIELPSVAHGNQTNHEFAVRLIGRIIFCWFLREKKSLSSLPLVSKDLLSLNSAKATNDYYHTRLEPLFFEVLNKPIKSRKDLYQKSFFAQIPYLNGGLFSPQVDDYYSFDEGSQTINHNTVKIPDIWLVELFEVLERYNFTVDENTSVDIDLSIDPEMLGRIFENLLAEINPETDESARKSTGSYYTPRTIVEYMVDESLYQHLKEKTGISEEKLRALSSYDLSDDESHPLTEVEKEKVVEALSNVTILDPACGSGAFPIGALQKIVFMLQRIDPDAKLWFHRQIQTTPPEVRKLIEHEFEHKNFDYIRKLGIIRKGIFGVDIQPIATEISRLRCFLTLVVEETVKDDEPNRGVEPLPNLDFKFVTANSLIGLPSSTAINQIGLFEDDIGIKELKNLRDMFFNATGDEREQLKLKFVQAQNRMFQRMISDGRRGFADLTTKLSSWDPFTHKVSTWFDPDWMFGIKDGFDIVMTNPPYMQIKQITLADRKLYKAIFNSAVGRFNLFYFFIEMSSKLVKQNGISSFIVPDRLLLNTQCDGLRKWLLIDQQIIEIDSFSEGVFENAIVDSILLFFKNQKTIYTHVKVKDRVDLNGLNAKFVKQIPINYFSESPNQQFDLSYNPVIASILSKLNNISIKLSKISETKDGIIQSKIPDLLFMKKPLDSVSKPLLFGKDIDRYVTSFNHNWVNYKPEEMMAAELKRNGGGLRLRVKGIFEINKILTRQTADEIIASWDDSKYYYSNTLHGTTITNESYNPFYVLALLNSRLITWYYRKTTAEEGKVFAQIKIELLRLLPIYKASQTEQKPFIEIVDNILAITKSDDYLKNLEKQAQIEKYEKQIDQMVYVLYNLTEEEKKVVEENTV